MSPGMGEVRRKYDYLYVSYFLGFTIDHLKKLQPIVEKLDKKHEYEKVIFYSYLENGDFTLTPEQRIAAYTVYRETR